MPFGRRWGRSLRTASAGRPVLAALGHACGGRGSASLLQQGTWAGELLERLCNRGFVLVGTFFVSLMVGLWNGRLSFERFGHKSREVGWDCAKIPVGTNT